ncbi:Dirigent protein 18 [Sesamum alatum]|uniref:Dirigent protein 18 n=1 Tax=Sesamum alatum TaxID=300844 RepID=A0AAE2CJT2_9LAMI|nr:Dirigent protein 18 [Sesamum alatum]
MLLGRSYVPAPKKEPLIAPKKEADLKPQTINTDKAAEVKKKPVSLMTNAVKGTYNSSNRRSAGFRAIHARHTRRSSPTARPITGLLATSYSGQVPFARPLGFLPPKDGVAIPNSNGAIPTINPSGVPLGTGLIGTAFAGINNNNNNNNGQNINTAQLGPDGLGLGFGTITVIDDYLTSAPELGSQQLGKATRGLRGELADGSTQMIGVYSHDGRRGVWRPASTSLEFTKIGKHHVEMLSVTAAPGSSRMHAGLRKVRSAVSGGSACYGWC